MHKQRSRLDQWTIKASLIYAEISKATEIARRYATANGYHDDMQPTAGLLAQRIEERRKQAAQLYNQIAQARSETDREKAATQTGIAEALLKESDNDIASFRTYLVRTIGTAAVEKLEAEPITIDATEKTHDCTRWSADPLRVRADLSEWARKNWRKTRPGDTWPGLDWKELATKKRLKPSAILREIDRWNDDQYLKGLEKAAEEQGLGFNVHHERAVLNSTHPSLVPPYLDIHTRPQIESTTQSLSGFFIDGILRLRDSESPALFAHGLKEIVKVRIRHIRGRDWIFDTIEYQKTL